MALADLIVVMSEGKIEQAGSPREIFNAPRTEFVARFIGGHNVISRDGRKLSVRTDRTRLVPEAAPAERAWPVTVRDVEYQGTSVFVSLEAAGGVELTAIVPERAFYERPFAAGQPAAVEWDEADIHELAA
jgi:putative spermidine/putrescine transport system ATP-binding protein